MQRIREKTRVTVEGHGSGVVVGWLSSSIVSVKLDRAAIIHVHRSIITEAEESSASDLHLERRRR